MPVLVIPIRRVGRSVAAAKWIDILIMVGVTGLLLLHAAMGPSLSA
jgi:hypothetical protein